MSALSLSEVYLLNRNPIQYDISPPLHHDSTCESLFRKINTFVEERPLVASTSAIALGIAGKLSSMYGKKIKRSVFKTTGVASYAAAGTLGCIILNKWAHLPKFFIWTQAVSALNVNLGVQVGMNTPQYTERSCSYENSLTGETISATLRYETDRHGHSLPILDLREINDPFERGRVTSLMLGKEIKDFYFLALRPMLGMFALDSGDFRYKKLKKTIECLRVPKETWQQGEGIHVGIREYSSKTGISTENIGMDQFREVQTIADAYKGVLYSLGCSLVVIRKGKELVVGRNLDWPDMSYLGQRAIITLEKGYDKEYDRDWEIKSLTYPAYLGALQASNGYIQVILNEGGKETREQGVPHTLFTLELLKKARSVEEVSRYLEVWGDERLPGSSCNITIVDNEGNARVFSFYPNMTKHPDLKYSSRSYERIGDADVLIVTNHAPEVQGSESCQSSQDRYDRIKSHVKNKLQAANSLSEIALGAIQQKGVNQAHTVATTLSHCSDIEAKTETTMDYAFDNAYAANHLSTTR